MKNEDKIILSLCGGTGAWEKPYKNNGYDVRNITLPEYDVRMYKPPKNVYGILAAPPCMNFSIAKTTKTPDFEKGMEIVKACLNIIWQCRYKPLYRKDNSLKFWALENPRGFLRQFLGKPYFEFKAYEFGDLWIKSTDVWGYFNELKKIDAGKLFQIDKNRIMKTLAYKTKERAITPPGFANAFFKANK